MAPKKLKVLFVASEAAPFAKSGGLGDVAGTLPKALCDAGIDCRLVMPKYSKIPNDLLIDIKYEGAVPVKMGWRNTGASVFKVNKYKSDVPTYLIENHTYFNREGLYGYYDDNERFAFFCRVVLEMLPLIRFKPDIIHVNDWQTGPLCILLQDFYKKSTYYQNIKCVYTIHNIQYQGVFGKEALSVLDLPDYYFSSEGMEFYGAVNYMKAGLVAANAITTVSKTYANEIQTGQYGYGMDGLLRSRHSDLCGIVNGLDYRINNPETDELIYEKFSDYDGKQINKQKMRHQLGLDEDDSPVIGIISRLADQKGFDLICMAMDEIVHKGAQLVVLGTGEGRFEHMFKDLERRHPGRVSANIMFDGKLAQRIYAGSDFFLMPSLFEPCGLGQLIAMRYGSIPIVRCTGGLADTVTHFNALLGEGTGFVFNDYVADAMMWAVNEALTVYGNKDAMKKLVSNAMAADFSWDKSAQEYVKMYNNVASGESII